MNRGSEWRIWDLHVHTPYSIEHNYIATQEEDVWEKYIQALENLPKDIKVLGINDYLFIDGYRKVLEYKNRGRLANIELILPVVEFRLAKFCGHKTFKRINYHVIFSDKVTADQIQQQFLNALTAHYTLSPDHNVAWGGVITRESLQDLGERIIASVPEANRSGYGSPIKEGFNNLNLEITSIHQALQNASYIFEGKYITAIGKTEWDDLKWDDGSIAEKKTIINSVDIVFTAAESIDKYNSAKSKLKEQGVNDLLLDCSDSHTFAENTTTKDRLGNCLTWIKADPTFEGLKQILYEPEERIRVQMSKPDEKNIYQVIDSVTLNEENFWQGTIYFNQNLNTIIGGRSTGKSSLLKAIAAKHGSNEVKEDDFVRPHLEGVDVRWKDGDDQLGRNIEFFPQSYMHEVARDAGKTSRLIESIIQNKGNDVILSEYYNRVKDLHKTITEEIYTLFLQQGELVSLRQQLIEKGKKEGILQQLKILKDKVRDLQKQSTLTDEERTSFEALQLAVKENTKQIESADKDLAIFESLLVASPIDSQYPSKWHFEELVSHLNQSELSRSFTNLKIKTETEWIQIVTSFKEATSKRKEHYVAENTRIVNSEVFKKGRQAFVDNKELGDISIKIVEEEKKIKEIETLEQRLNNIKEQRNSLFHEVTKNHCELRERALSVKDNLAISYDGLEISVGILFHQKEMQEMLENAINLKAFERQEYVQNLVKFYDSDTNSKAKDYLKQLLLGEIQLKNGYAGLNAATEFFSKNWYSLDFHLTYQRDDFKSMSEGKQAFVILKLLLDFSDKKCPILIDQPEDSLDNRAIYKDLVEYIKAKKRTRQIILVTHNSNVVVSADSENVIVANQEGADSHNLNGFKFQYKNGALEDTKPKDDQDAYILSSQGIREHVCDILEGGRAAFEKREQKYGFK